LTNKPSSIKNGSITILTNKNFHKEKAYIISVFCKDFLNVDYEVEVDDSVNGYLVSYNNVIITLPDVFFGNFYEDANKNEPNVETIVTGLAKPETTELPAWFFISQKKESVNDYTIPVDIFGMAFFLMSGFSDLKFSKKDQHGRDIGKSSFIANYNLIDRPIIQEWFTVLSINLFGREFLNENEILPKYKTHISHDVDQPFEYLDYTIQRLLKRVLGDLLIRKNANTAKNRIELFKRVKGGEEKADPYNNFESLLEVLKDHQIKSTFFFVAGGKHPSYDVSYNIGHPAIKKIVKKVADANHTIGIHPSYETLKNPILLKKEVEILQNICTDIGIHQKIETCRKHYLRWSWESTPKNLSSAGIKDDYTLGYADHSGFRAGVGFPFRAFDWETKKQTDLMIHPLIVMECSLLDHKYMNLNIFEAEEKIKKYQNQLKKLGGEFVILWHNHRLIETVELELFKKSISS
tara:strand:- start:44715 stop:46106 length:1392 start_codon:yes stop_codon:yes gene_type:complete